MQRSGNRGVRRAGTENLLAMGEGARKLEIGEKTVGDGRAGGDMPCCTCSGSRAGFCHGRTGNTVQVYKTTTWLSEWLPVRGSAGLARAG